MAERVWEGFDNRSLTDDTDAKIALREALLADLPDGDGTQASRVDLLFTLGGLYWAKGAYDKAVNYLQLALALVCPYR